MADVAFLGLGTMGRGMVRNLVDAGHRVTAWNRSGGDVEPLGAQRADSIADAVRDAEFVLFCLSDDAAVDAVVFGDGGLLASVKQTAVVVDLSTISPEAGDRERAAFEQRGIAFLDAPVFGSKGEAAAGGLWVVVGGDAETLARALPVLEAISESVHHIGPGGSGVRMKLVGNLVVASQLLALGEALTLASRAGLDLRAVLGVLKVTDFRSPIFDGVGPAVLDDDYAPSFALELMQKDAGLITAFATSLDAPVPSVEAARHYIDAAMIAGRGKHNASALIKSVAEEAGARLSDR